MAVCLSAILVFIAVLKIQLVLAPLCYVPLFIVLQQRSTKPVAAGIVFGATLSLLSFFWMIPGAQRFTGESALYGVVVAMLSALFLIGYWVLLFVAFHWLQLPVLRWRDAAVNAVLAGCLWVLAEAVLALLSMRMPWFLFRSGMSLSGNLYAVQPIAMLGVGIASFVVVVVNCLLAYAVQTKLYKRLLLPLAVALVYMACGYGLFYFFEQKKSPLPTVKAAILTENIPASMRWDESSGNALVNRLLTLAKDAALMKPDLAIWSESTVPWTFRPDDDFVHEIVNITKAHRMTHIIGINSDAGAEAVYNSVYALQPDGKVAGRYNKQYLLSFIEQPVGGLIFPFLSSGGYVAVPGNNAQPLVTQSGKAGILICNESTVSAAAADLVRNGAQFILNLSNDGWFSDTYIADQHFYNARLRAVETRKDVVVNSNDGITGLIKASGAISLAQRSNEPMTNLVDIEPNNWVPLAVASPYVMLFASGLVVLAGVGIAVKRR